MKKTYLYAGVSILFWSTTATVSKLLLNTLNSYQVLMFNAFFASLALLIVNIFTGIFKLIYDPTKLKTNIINTPINKDFTNHLNKFAILFIICLNIYMPPY